jgi:SAM-dependent methyltransferase
MLLTITTTHPPATELGFLLHKNPARVQSFDLSFGQAHVFYPEATAERCTAALLLDVDPVGLVRGAGAGPDVQYVNDRPYVASSFTSVAIAQVFGSALNGTSRDRPELAASAIPLEATLAVVPCAGGEEMLRRLFEPLGYAVTAERHALDPRFPEWGESRYYTVTLAATVRLADLLRHLYVLVPVLDDAKHYFVGDAEVDKLLRQGEGWLEGHPDRELITRRYLRHQPSLSRGALATLVAAEEPVDSTDSGDEMGHVVEAVDSGDSVDGDAVDPAHVVDVEPVAPVHDADPVDPIDPVDVVGPTAGPDADAEAQASEATDAAKLSLNQQRLNAVAAVLAESGARRVVDLGCGEGRLLRMLLKNRQFEEVVGMDVSIRALEVARERLKLERLPASRRGRIRLIHGSLMYRDERIAGFDAAAVVEVVEHLDPPRLRAFERVLFEFARPGTVVLTTPNRDYNPTWETLPAGQFRHGDHRFEWSRAEFQEWAAGVAARFGYTVRFLPVGPQDPALGAPTQMGVFSRE